jgi:hypothetical protein
MPGPLVTDDVLHPKATTKMVEAAARRPDAGLYSGAGARIRRMERGPWARRG